MKMHHAMVSRRLAAKNAQKRAYARMLPVLLKQWAMFLDNITSLRESLAQTKSRTQQYHPIPSALLQAAIFFILKQLSRLMIQAEDALTILMAATKAITIALLPHLLRLLDLRRHHINTTTMFPRTHSSRLAYRLVSQLPFTNFRKALSPTRPTMQVHVWDFLFSSPYSSTTFPKVLLWPCLYTW